MGKDKKKATKRKPVPYWLPADAPPEAVQFAEELLGLPDDMREAIRRIIAGVYEIDTFLRQHGNDQQDRDRVLRFVARCFVMLCQADDIEAPNESGDRPSSD